MQLPLDRAFRDHPLPGDELPYVDVQLSPAEVRGLAAGAQVVITGRMHLAIMSMSSGVPAITFSTHGKVSGLMRLFGVDELCVEPGEDMADRIKAASPHR